MAMQAAVRNRATKHPLYQFLKWIAGFFAVVFGWRLITPWFWVSVGLTYLGFLLLVISVWIETEPRIRRPWRVIAVAAIAVLVGLYSRGSVFFSAPLELTAVATAAEYPPGTQIGSVQWKPYYTSLETTIHNPTSDPYTEVDLLLRPDEPVAAVGQTTNIPDVSFQDRYELQSQAVADGKVVPLVMVATDAGYKLHCGSIPPQQSLRVIMALVSVAPSKVNSTEKAAWGLHPEGLDPRNPEAVWRNHVTDGQNHYFYWYFHQLRENWYGPRPIPHKLEISGHFTAHGRRRTVNETLDLSTAQ